MIAAIKGLKILGVTGTAQTGKSELAPVFESSGLTFCDLNDQQCDLRAKGTGRYELFNTRFPGCLRDDGAKLPAFYDIVTPEFYHERVKEDVELMIPVVRELCARRADSRPMVLSWEYLLALVKHLPLDHTLLLTSNETI